MGSLGYGYGEVGRTEDAVRIVRELENDLLHRVRLECSGKNASQVAFADFWLAYLAGQANFTSPRQRIDMTLTTARFALVIPRCTSAVSK
jgi:hypothetical protein